MGSAAGVAFKMFENGIKVALAFARGSYESAHFVAKKLLPITLSRLKGNAITEQEKYLVLNLTMFISKES